MDRHRNPARAVQGALLALLASVATADPAAAGASDATTAPTNVAGDAAVALPVAEIERMLVDEPFTILAAAKSRPNVRGDITLKAELSFAGAAPLRVKLRMATPGADRYNNQPRHDLAAYRLQALFLDADEYVAPPTALRFIRLDEARGLAPGAKPTFLGCDEVLAVVQYWLPDVKVVEDVYSPTLYAADPAYARQIEQFNVFTWLIAHGDSNVGNFLVSSTGPGARVYSVDNGVAFESGGGERGRPWNELRVTRLPADTVQRLRRVSLEDLRARLGVVAQWSLAEGRFIPVRPTPNLDPERGVRRERDILQMGLTAEEVDGVWQRLQRLLGRLDDGRIAAYSPPDATPINRKP